METKIQPGAIFDLMGFFKENQNAVIPMDLEEEFSRFIIENFNSKTAKEDLSGKLKNIFENHRSIESTFFKEDAGTFSSDFHPEYFLEKDAVYNRRLSQDPYGKKGAINFKMEILPDSVLVARIFPRIGKHNGHKTKILLSSKIYFCPEDMIFHQFERYNQITQESFSLIADKYSFFFREFAEKNNSIKGNRFQIESKLEIDSHKIVTTVLNAYPSKHYLKKEKSTCNHNQHGVCQYLR